jgi:hypothetical protein
MSGSLSRQARREQRRRMEKQQRFDARYGESVMERQNKIDDRTVELYAVCMGLAVYDEYGCMPNRIKRIVQAFCRRMTMFAESGATYQDYVRELKEKTGVEFVWTE